MMIKAKNEILKFNNKDSGKPLCKKKKILNFNGMSKCISKKYCSYIII